MERENARCGCCNKKAPIHYMGYGKNKIACCRSFHYYVTHKVWKKAGKCEQLCLFCLRNKLKRDFVVDDFPLQEGFNGDYRTDAQRNRYITKMIKYANSRKNTSRVW